MTLAGEWTVDEGYLLMTVDQSFFQMIANGSGDTHAGVEVDDAGEECVYVRLMQRS